MFIFSFSCVPFLLFKPSDYMHVMALSSIVFIVSVPTCIVFTASIMGSGVLLFPIEICMCDLSFGVLDVEPNVRVKALYTQYDQTANSPN